MKSVAKYAIAAVAVVAVVVLSIGSFAADDAKKADAVKTEASKAAPAKSAPTKAEGKRAMGDVVERGWAQRCPEKDTDKKKCEIFQRIDMKDSKARVAEFAVGFPQEKGFEKGDARGAVVLPLGILLETGVEMKIDDGKPMTFKTRFCTNGGCFSFVSLKKSVVDEMRKGKAVTFIFRTAEGRNVNLVMSLDGFAKAVDSLQTP